MPSILAPNPTPKMVTDFLEKTANQLSSIQFNMIALGNDLLECRIKEAASDVGSDAGTFSQCLGKLFAFWAEYIQGQELQLRLLFPNIVQEREAHRPAKQQALATKAQRVQDPYTVPHDWDWEKINAISSLMKVCKGRIPPELALAITKAFEFCLKSTPAHPTTVLTESYALAAAAPGTSAGQPQGPSTSPAKSKPPPPLKPKAPVVHVPALKDQTKLLRYEKFRQ
ncbi:hypothetical protein BC835DRAFT_1306358 [Cytidiella melzeri]|nr:hypothetical protein BC835DRAFT_1306358 [Cytidiella melzeri]